MQAALDIEVQEHEALEVEGVQSASSLGSRLIALSGCVNERLWGTLHTGVKRALAVVSSHYAVNHSTSRLSATATFCRKMTRRPTQRSRKLMEAVEAPSTVLASLFEEEVVPPTPAADP